MPKITKKSSTRRPPSPPTPPLPSSSIFTCGAFHQFEACASDILTPPTAHKSSRNDVEIYHDYNNYDDSSADDNSDNLTMYSDVNDDEASYPSSESESEATSAAWTASIIKSEIKNTINTTSKQNVPMFESVLTFFGATNFLNRNDPTPKPQIEKHHHHHHRKSRATLSTLHQSPPPPVIGELFVHPTMCHFSSIPISSTTRCYVSLTPQGQTLLLHPAGLGLSSSCPTISDTDLLVLSRVYPAKWRLLPLSLKKSASWERVSKYCSITSLPIPDGIPFYYALSIAPKRDFYLLPSTMDLPCTKSLLHSLPALPPSHLHRQHLTLLSKLHPSSSLKLPRDLIRKVDSWKLVSKFCFFSEGPINEQFDVYYETNVGDGIKIYMLALLNLPLTPEDFFMFEKYDTVDDVYEAERSSYELKNEDFEDLMVCHEGKCEMLNERFMTPEPWTKVEPVRYSVAREMLLDMLEGKVILTLRSKDDVISELSCDDFDTETGDSIGGTSSIVTVLPQDQEPAHNFTFTPEITEKIEDEDEDDYDDGEVKNNNQLERYTTFLSTVEEGEECDSATVLSTPKSSSKGEGNSDHNVDNNVVVVLNEQEQYTVTWRDKERMKRAASRSKELRKGKVVSFFEREEEVMNDESRGD